jgi:predicted anti-sigma-YlaC factor YlaD
MQCQELMAALNDYIDGETQSALCQALAGHLADCNPCRVVIDNIRQTITLYRVGAAMPLPAGVHEQIHAMTRRRWAVAFPAAAGAR